MPFPNGDGPPAKGKTDGDPSSKRNFVRNSPWAMLPSDVDPAASGAAVAVAAVVDGDGAAATVSPPEPRSRRSSLSNGGERSSFSNGGDDVEEEGVHLQHIERLGLRLAGLDSYATLTSLIAGLSTLNLSDLSTAFADGATAGPVEKAVVLISLVLQTLTISLGLHATLVFSMCSLYAKTAIGESRDEAYEVFMKNTGAVRMRGFSSFLWTFISFGLNLLFGLVCRLPLAYAAPVCILAGTVLYFVWVDVQTIIGEAGYIFAPRPPKRD